MEQMSTEAQNLALNSITAPYQQEIDRQRELIDRQAAELKQI